MSNLKTGPKLCRFLANGLNTGSLRDSRAYNFAARCCLSQRAKDADKTSQKQQAAADAVKDTAEEVKKTAKVIANATKSTAETINKMTKVVSEKVTECADAVKGKAKETIVSGASKAAEATMEKIKDKVAGK